MTTIETQTRHADHAIDAPATAFGISYPDNPLREARLQQLVSDAFNYLREASDAYEELIHNAAAVNEAIAAAYRNAGATPPETTPVEYSEPGTLSTVISYSKLIAPLALAIAEIYHVQPAIARWLVRSGRMTEQAAGELLANRLGRVFGWTRGGLRAGLLGTALTAVVIVAIEVVLDVIEGADRKTRLVEGIRQFVPARGAAYLSKLKLGILNTSLQSVIAAFKALESIGVRPGPEEIERLVKTAVQPFVDRSNAMTIEAAQARLALRDLEQNAYLADDLPASAAGVVGAGFKLRQRTGLVADVAGASKAPRASVVVWGDNGGANQQWLAAHASSAGLALQSRNSSLVMDVAVGGSEVGSPVIQFGYHGGANQLWHAFPAGGSEDAVFLLSKLSTRRGPLALQGSAKAGDQLTVQWLDGGDAQIWLPTTAA